MFPFFFHQEPKTKEELQRESMAREARELKQALEKMSPEDRAKFWADIEGKRENQEDQIKLSAQFNKIKECSRPGVCGRLDAFPG